MEKDRMITEAEKFGELLHWGFGPVLDVKVNENPKTSVLSTGHVEMHFDGIFRAVPSYVNGSANTLGTALTKLAGTSSSSA